MVKVSVIIPVYNAELFLKKCLNSVIDQSLKELEIICVDDGSTDGSKDILQQYKKKDTRIKVYSQANKGAGAARNLGLKYATGEYVHFLDADDWLEDRAYEQTYKLLEKTEADLCVFLYIRYDNKKETERKVQLFNTGNAEYKITNFEEEYWHFCNTSVVPWNKLYRRDFLVRIGAFFDEIVCANDRAFYFQVITAASKIVKYPKHLIFYRENNENSLVGKGREKHFNCHLTANRRIFEIGEKYSEEIKQRIVNMNMQDLFSFFTKSNKEQKEGNFQEICTLLNEKVGLSNIDHYKAKPWYANGKIALLSMSLTDSNKIIPIVFAANNSYAPFLDVAILSLIDHMDSGYFYDIYIFETDLIDSYIKQLERHKGVNYRVNCINIEAKLQSNALKVRAHYSKEMYYRILIPELLYQYEKAIYLDCDIIINKDVAELYKQDVSDVSIAAVHNALNNSMFRYVKNMLHIDPGLYFNSGILLINIDEFVKQKIKTKCFDLLQVKENLVCPDQDLLNLASRGSNRLFDSGWNYQWHGMLPGADKVEQVSMDSLKNAAQKKYIIHYTSGKKAWSFPEQDDAAIFWEYARQSTFEPMIRQIGVSKRINTTVYEAISSLKQKSENNSKGTCDVAKLKDDLDAIKNSFSFKLGRFLTWPLRKIKKIILKSKDKNK